MPQRPQLLTKLVIFLLASVLVGSGFGRTLPTAEAAWPTHARDTLADSRVGAASEQTITLTESAGTAFSSGKTITVTFPAQFTLPTFTASDLSFSDGTTRTVLGVCANGANNVSFGVAGQVITFTACSGFVSQPAGSTITLVLGQNTTKITNPSSATVYGVQIGGSYGDDSLGVAVVITQGVAMSLTVGIASGNLNLIGEAFPAAFVTILDNGAVAGTTVANSASIFNTTLYGLATTSHTIGIYCQDGYGHQTLTLSFSVTVINGLTLTVSGIILPPILSVPSQSKRPAAFTQSGLAVDSGQVTTYTNGKTVFSDQTTANASGAWLINITNTLHLGAHTVAGTVTDTTGSQSILTDPAPLQILMSADLNNDTHVNLTDFSILMYNYGLANPPDKAADIVDSGGQVDLVDFSVMMYNWTN